MTHDEVFINLIPNCYFRSFLPHRIKLDNLSHTNEIICALFISQRLRDLQTEGKQ